MHRKHLQKNNIWKSPKHWEKVMSTKYKRFWGGQVDRQAKNKHIIVKTVSILNKKNIEVCKREVSSTFKCKSMRISANFSIETLKAKRAWKDQFQALKENWLSM
jgi:hypothetical protein